ncbi:MAG: hypothetical protein KME11_00240 [Timaviella obliquedivisa GSE-PSE-MK23-08B]|jgi:hypothetical protein|nr:hypothetical protein [Timaviella obliquedivisa GSE-PSE-MK23-08B]
MKISYLLMTAFVMVSMFDGASFALSRYKMPQMQPPLVQPQAEKRTLTGQAIALTNWVRLSSKFYKLRQHLR